MEETNQQQRDVQLIQRVALADQTAFAALYDRLSGPLFSLALKILGDNAEAEDALQDVFLQIWRRAPNYDSTQSSVFSWAMLITRGRVIDRLRARSRRLRVVSGSTDDASRVVNASDVENAADFTEKTRVRSLLQKLPPDQRQAIELAFFQDLTHHEIAAQLSQPLGTIKARIRRGLLKLRERVAL
jgi:RNA polymerase sigma-70 factor (ECF subfamily)